MKEKTIIIDQFDGAKTHILRAKPELMAHLRHSLREDKKEYLGPTCIECGSSHLEDDKGVLVCTVCHTVCGSRMEEEPFDDDGELTPVSRIKVRNVTVSRRREDRKRKAEVRKRKREDHDTAEREDSD